MAIHQTEHLIVECYDTYLFIFADMIDLVTSKFWCHLIHTLCACVLVCIWAYTLYYHHLNSLQSIIECKFFACFFFATCRLEMCLLLLWISINWFSKMIRTDQNIHSLNSSTILLIANQNKKRTFSLFLICHLFTIWKREKESRKNFIVNNKRIAHSLFVSSVLYFSSII